MIFCTSIAGCWNKRRFYRTEIALAYETYQFHQIYQKLHHYCVVTLGGFYLDIIKDRMYTCQPESHARRSAQTAMYHVAEAFARWLAPISELYR